jgi:hypothetical protein
VKPGGVRPLVGRREIIKMETEVIQSQPQEMWATVELMGHAQTAGRISRPSDWGGLLRVDVPTAENGTYRSEFYGMTAIYAIKLVSEEIARAFVQPTRGVIAYDTPIVTREQHENAVRQLDKQNDQLRTKINELERRLTAVKALPAQADEEEF